MSKFTKKAISQGILMHNSKLTKKGSKNHQFTQRGGANILAEFRLLLSINPINIFDICKYLKYLIYLSDNLDRKKYLRYIEYLHNLVNYIIIDLNNKSNPTDPLDATVATVNCVKYILKDLYPTINLEKKIFVYKEIPEENRNNGNIIDLLIDVSLYLQYDNNYINIINMYRVFLCNINDGFNVQKKSDKYFYNRFDRHLFAFLIKYFTDKKKNDEEYKVALDYCLSIIHYGKDDVSDGYDLSDYRGKYLGQFYLFICNLINIKDKESKYNSMLFYIKYLVCKVLIKMLEFEFLEAKDTKKRSEKINDILSDKDYLKLKHYTGIDKDSLKINISMTGIFESMKGDKRINKVFIDEIIKFIKNVHGHKLENSLYKESVLLNMLYYCDPYNPDIKAVYEVKSSLAYLLRIDLGDKIKGQHFDSLISEPNFYTSIFGNTVYNGAYNIDIGKDKKYTRDNNDVHKLALKYMGRKSKYNNDIERLKKFKTNLESITPTPQNAARVLVKSLASAGLPRVALYKNEPNFLSTATRGRPAQTSGLLASSHNSAHTATQDLATEANSENAAHAASTVHSAPENAAHAAHAAHAASTVHSAAQPNSGNAAHAASTVHAAHAASTVHSAAQPNSGNAAHAASTVHSAHAASTVHSAAQPNSGNAVHAASTVHSAPENAAHAAHAASTVHSAAQPNSGNAQQRVEIPESPQSESKFAQLKRRLFPKPPYSKFTNLLSETDHNNSKLIPPKSRQNNKKNTNKWRFWGKKSNLSVLPQLVSATEQQEHHAVRNKEPQGQNERSRFARFFFKTEKEKAEKRSKIESQAALERTESYENLRNNNDNNEYNNRLHSGAWDESNFTSKIQQVPAQRAALRAAQRAVQPVTQPVTQPEPAQLAAQRAAQRTAQPVTQPEPAQLAAQPEPEPEPEQEIPILTYNPISSATLQYNMQSKQISHA
jgi:hypothetical protein